MQTLSDDLLCLLFLAWVGEFFGVSFLAGVVEDYNYRHGKNYNKSCVLGFVYAVVVLLTWYLFTKL